MGKAIEVRGAHGAFLVETDTSVTVPPDFAVKVDAVRRGRLPEGMQQVSTITDLGRDFADVRDLVVTCCNSLYDAIAQIKKPEKVAIEFGVKLAGEAGVPMLTKASGEANFKISIEWKPGGTGGSA